MPPTSAAAVRWGGPSQFRHQRHLAPVERPVVADASRLGTMSYQLGPSRGAWLTKAQSLASDVHAARSMPTRRAHSLTATVSIVAVSAAMWQFSLSVAGDGTGKVVAGDGNSVCLVVVLVVILVAIVIILYLVSMVSTAIQFVWLWC